MNKDIEKCGFVFVYGTLKENHGNSYLLKGCQEENLGLRVTEERYLLGNVGFPYLFKRETLKDIFEEDIFRQVMGELWSLTNPRTLKVLDRLEGYPEHYKREVIELTSGEKAWTYYQPDARAILYCDVCDVVDDKWSWK